jgi:hypothetical protein
MAGDMGRRLRGRNGRRMIPAGQKKRGSGMSAELPQPSTTSLTDRVKNILMQPKDEWGRIDAEPATVAGIFKSYVVPLAAIGPVAGLIGMSVFGIRLFGFTYRLSFGAALSTAIASYVAALIGVYILAMILNALAPNFGGQKSEVQAMKVAAYSCTASWIAGIFQIVPALAWLAILGLYSLYLLWTGAPRLMRVPQDKAATYTIVTIVAAIVLFFLIGLVASSVTSMFTPRVPLPNGTLSVPVPIGMRGAKAEVTLLAISPTTRNSTIAATIVTIV